MNKRQLLIGTVTAGIVSMLPTIAISQPSVLEILKSKFEYHRFFAEFNDNDTRNSIISHIDQIFNENMEYRNIGWVVVCDTSNNTNNDIDNNRLNVNVYYLEDDDVNFKNITMTLATTEISLEDIA